MELAGKESVSVTLSTTSPVWVLNLGDGENRFSTEFLSSVDQALTAITDSSEPAALMITATGKFFSNGLDLEWLAANTGEWDADPLIRFARGVPRYL